MNFTRALIACAAIAAATPAFAQSGGDPVAGKEVFKKCLLCHTNEAGKNKIGPSLFGIVGRHSASIDGFPYSPAMKAFNVTWTPEELFTYLEHPMTIVKGTKMAFPGLPTPEERNNVIAYLQTLK